MLAHKKVTKSGGITIPRMLRQQLGMNAGAAVDVAADETGLHITKHVMTCFHCDTADDVICCFGLEVCRSCADQIRKEFDTSGGN